MKIYAVLCQNKNGTGDVSITPCGSESEAVAKAEHDWNYLTPREQERREISACVSEANEDGEFNLGAYDVIKRFA